jgi:hypothetical protein
MTVAVCTTLKGILGAQRACPDAMQSDESHALIPPLARLAVTIAKEIYFGSGAYDEQRASADTTSRSFDLLRVRRFLTEITPALDALAELPILHIAHDIIQTLEYLAPADPPNIFRRIGRVALAGQGSGFQFEPQAKDLIVRIIERYLAEYRFIFRDDTECQQLLVSVLDSFVRVGWPAAVQLAYRLDEIHR